ncbi:MAG: glycosyltransferase [Chloroflexota bacterium]|nr:glycosyltransferase [Chloroflexota bacterium]
MEEERDQLMGRPPRVSVLMPTYAQAAFIVRAIESLRAQTLPDWELLVVDDGSPDRTAETVAPYLADGRIHYTRLERNRGLGVALNHALGLARAPLLAYLPSDDLYYPDHLASLIACLERYPGAPLAFSGVRHGRTCLAEGQVEGYPLQLVQVMHRRGAGRWLEREEYVTDDLERMFWAKLRPRGTFAGTGRVTCEWVDHPAQRHKLIPEPRGGGINPYRLRHNVPHPLRFHSSVGHWIDEVEYYRRFRERPDTPPAPDGLKILLVGELAYNAERVLALEERGHKLYGLWTPDPYWYSTVGPLPFGHVEDLPRAGWREAVRRIQPDVIYALLNWQAVPFAHQVLTAGAGVPFVWHFKEGPFHCLERGTWPQLVDLQTRSDGQIYSSPEARNWFAAALPGGAAHGPTLILDGDLPKRDWFAAARAPRLSEADGQPHTVLAGRPIGLDPCLIGDLAASGIHVHFYGDFTQREWRDWLARARAAAGAYLHLHPNVDQRGWVGEFSRYDAGWLHFFKSENGGDPRRATWDDLNYPARIATLVAAGLPLLQYDNAGATVATQSLARDRDLGLFFTDAAGLRAQLDDTALMTRVRESVWRQRDAFTFDHHADRLIALFRRVIAEAPRR